MDESERVDVRWAGFSIVMATLRLIKKCLSSNNKYDYVILISGQDFPAKSNLRLLQYLEENKGSNYIDIIPSNNNCRSILSKRNELYYPCCMYGQSIVVKSLRMSYLILTGGRKYTFPFLRRKNTTNLHFAYGSQWWCLQSECLSWMMEYINTHPEYMAFFEHSLVPDECFFQTLFSISPYKMTKKNKLVWMEWQGSHPRLIEENDIDRIVDDNTYFFARKFDIAVDYKPIKKMIERLNGL